MMFNLCHSATTHGVSINQIENNMFGKRSKNVVDNMICFQQAACKFLQSYKKKNLHTPWKNQSMR